MQLASERREQGTAAVLKDYRGCGEVSLNFTRNVAGRNGGAIFYDSCQGLNDGRYCFLQLSTERAILFHYNVAGSAGGSVYIECSSIGLVCDLSFGAYNKIGALTSLPKAEFRGSSAEFYGDNVATKARRMSWEDQDSIERLHESPAQTIRYVRCVQTSLSRESPTAQLLTVPRIIQAANIVNELLLRIQRSQSYSVYLI